MCEAFTFHPHNHAVKSIVLKNLKITSKWFRDWYYLFARRLGDRFWEHLHADIERNETGASKPVARHLNLLHRSKQHMTVCGLSLHPGNSERPKTQEKNCISNRYSYSPRYQRVVFIQLIQSCFLVAIFPLIAWLHFLHVNTHHPQFFQSP